MCVLYKWKKTNQMPSDYFYVIISHNLISSFFPPLLSYRGLIILYAAQQINQQSLVEHVRSGASHRCHAELGKGGRGKTDGRQQRWGLCSRIQFSFGVHCWQAHRVFGELWNLVRAAKANILAGPFLTIIKAE